MGVVHKLVSDNSVKTRVGWDLCFVDGTVVGFTRHKSCSSNKRWVGEGSARANDRAATRSKEGLK